MDTTETTYEVTVIIAALGVRETFTVTAPREGLARTHAIGAYLNSGNVHPDFSGSFVEYEIDGRPSPVPVQA